MWFCLIVEATLKFYSHFLVTLVKSGSVGALQSGRGLRQPNTFEFLMRKKVFTLVNINQFSCKITIIGICNSANNWSQIHLVFKFRQQRSCSKVSPSKIMIINISVKS